MSSDLVVKRHFMKTLCLLLGYKRDRIISLSLIYKHTHLPTVTLGYINLWIGDKPWTTNTTTT